MRKFPKQISLIFILGCCSQLNFAEHSNSANKLNSLKTQVINLNNELVLEQKIISHEEFLLGKTEVQIGLYSKKIDYLNKLITSQEQKIKSLENERLLLNSLLQTKKNILQNQIRQQYQLNQISKVGLLLFTSDLATINKIVNYYAYFNRARAAQILSLRKKITELKNTDLSLSKSYEDLRISREELIAIKDKLLESNSQRKNIIASINHRIQSKEQAILQAQLKQKRLAKVISNLHQQAAQKSAPALTTENKFAAQKGQLPLPINLSSSAAKHILKKNSLFIAAEEGLAVKAIYAGKVVFADWLRGFGLLIIVDHGNGYMSLYAHNKSLYHAKGDQVAQGELIATVGNSGGVAESGLYLELRHHGKTINPAPWFACSATQLAENSNSNQLPASA